MPGPQARGWWPRPRVGGNAKIIAASACWLRLIFDFLTTNRFLLSHETMALSGGLPRPW